MGEGEGRPGRLHDGNALRMPATSLRTARVRCSPSPFGGWKRGRFSIRRVRSELLRLFPDNPSFSADRGAAPFQVLPSAPCKQTFRFPAKVGHYMPSSARA